MIVKSLKPFTPNTIKEKISKNPDIILVDIRPHKDFIKSHIPGSVSMPMSEGQFAIWAAYLLDGTNLKDSVILIGLPGREKEAITRLARTGIECVDGYLAGGIETWIHERNQTVSTNILDYESSEDFERQIKGWRIFDVRNPSEWDNGVLEVAELYHYLI